MQIQFSQLDLTESLMINFPPNIHKHSQEIKFIPNIQTDFTPHIIDYSSQIKFISHIKHTAACNPEV